MFKPMTWLLLPLSAIASMGCGIEPETLAKLQEAVKAASEQGQAGEVESASPLITQVATGPVYPERVDPFSFARERNAEPETDGDTNSAAPGEPPVRVLGFAHVDQPRVLLRIGDHTHSLIVGDRIDSVEVMAIRPPAADLRIGTLKQTVSMFDPR